MARDETQKLKLLYLHRILLENTDEKHGMTMKEIVSALEERGIHAERKSLYRDMAILGDFGLEVMSLQKNRTFYYYVVDRDFELPELKLMVDIVQSSKFITTNKSNRLIKKIEKLTNYHQAKQLQRQVYVIGKNKSINENIYYNVDIIHQAIGENKQIKFLYFQWNVKHEKQYHRNKEYYDVSPWALIWEDENYYLLGFDEKEKKIKHFRVDKIEKANVMETAREGKNEYDALSISDYTTRVFGMFGGKEQYVDLLFSNALAGVVIDRFGQDIVFYPKDENHFSIHVKIAISGQFFGWLFALGEGVSILGPKEVKEEFQSRLNHFLEGFSS